MKWDICNAARQPLGDAGPRVFCSELSRSDGRIFRAYGFNRVAEEPAPGGLVHDRQHGGEIRLHPLRQEWSIYAAHRQKRPTRPHGVEDPLAPMVEGGSATEVPLRDFELVVFDNGFPSLVPDPPPVERDAGTGAEVRPALGRCEVVVYQSGATGSLATVSQERRELLVLAWLIRSQSLREEGYPFVMPFENRGAEAGVTLHHPHAQIYAFPFVPAPQKRAARAFRDGYSLEGALETWGGHSVVAQTRSVVAAVPPFARFPYEVWIIPRRRRASLADLSHQELIDFAWLLGDTVARYDAFFECECPYMLNMQAAPGGEDATFHLSAQFFPLMRAPGLRKYMGSVENATGVFTVDVMPEKMAEGLRSAR